MIDTPPTIVGARRLVVVVGPSGAGKESVLRGRRDALDVAAPVDADLDLVNDGDLQYSVDALLQWWDALNAD